MKMVCGWVIVFLKIERKFALQIFFFFTIHHLGQTLFPKPQEQDFFKCIEFHEIRKIAPLKYTCYEVSIQCRLQPYLSCHIVHSLLTHFSRSCHAFLTSYSKCLVLMVRVEQWSSPSIIFSPSHTSSPGTTLPFYKQVRKDFMCTHAQMIQCLFSNTYVCM